MECGCTLGRCVVVSAAVVGAGVLGVVGSVYACAVPRGWQGQDVGAGVAAQMSAARVGVGEGVCVCVCVCVCVTCVCVSIIVRGVALDELSNSKQLHCTLLT